MSRQAKAHAQRTGQYLAPSSKDGTERLDRRSRGLEEQQYRSERKQLALNLSVLYLDARARQ